MYILYIHVYIYIYIYRIYLFALLRRYRAQQPNSYDFVHLNHPSLLCTLLSVLIRLYLSLSFALSFTHFSFLPHKAYSAPPFTFIAL